MTTNELLDKPVWQMTGEELLFLAQHGDMSTSRESPKTSSSKEKSDMCTGWLALHASLGAVRLPFRHIRCETFSLLQLKPIPNIRINLPAVNALKVFFRCCSTTRHNDYRMLKRWEIC